MPRKKPVTGDGRNKQLEQMKKYLEEIKKKGYAYKQKGDKPQENKTSLGNIGWRSSYGRQ